MDEYQVSWKLHSNEAFLLFQLMGMERVIGFTNPFQTTSPDKLEEALLQAREQLLRDEILVINDEELLIEPSLFSILQVVKLSQRICWLYLKKKDKVVDSYIYLSSRQVIEFVEEGDYLEITFIGNHDDFLLQIETLIAPNESTLPNESLNGTIKTDTYHFLVENYQTKTHNELYTSLLNEEEMDSEECAEIVNVFKTNLGIGQFVFLTRGRDDWGSDGLRFVLTQEHNFVFIESNDALKISKTNTDTFFGMLYEFEKSLIVGSEVRSLNSDAKDLLPIGSVVLLKNGVKKVMIYGRKQLLLQEDNPAMYDYVACYYPEGHINPDHTFVFNHDDIQEVVFYGYKNEEEERFIELLSLN